MGRHSWEENDYFAHPDDPPSGAPQPTNPPRQARAGRSLFYGALALFGLVLAAVAVWATAGRLGVVPERLKPVNILVVGIDERRQDVGRTDTVLLVTYNPDARRMHAVSLPRDTRVVIPGYNYHQKLNAAYALGGVDLTRRTIEDLLGLTIDYYFLVDFQGFARAVDALGGVTLDVPRQMDYDDRAQDLHIHLKPGRQRLTGKEALGFVRYRSDGLGDISLVDPVNQVYDGRVARQQLFVKALVEEALQPRNLWRIPSLIRIAAQTVETDMPLSRMVAYARSARKLTQGDLSTSILAGAGQMVGGVSYWVPEPDAARELVRVSLAVEKAPAAKPDALTRRLPLPDFKEGLEKVVSAVVPAKRPLPPARVKVLNGTGQAALATQAAKRLETDGFVLAGVGNAPHYGYDSTRVINRTGRDDAVAKLRTLAPRLEVEDEEAGVDAAGVDLVVIVGADFRL
ncbi:MAG: LCP family protein [Chitinophagales bacterium]